MTNLNAALQSLPEKVKDWLGDEHVAFIIDEINQRLNFSPDSERWRAIPHLVLRLCVQDLEPRAFINELSHKLKISFDSAKTLTKEIEEKILKPIEAPLKLEVGVDLKLLYFAISRSEVARVALVTPSAAERSRPISPLRPISRIITQPPLTTKPMEPIKPINPSMPEKPFILHEHQDLGAPAPVPNTAVRPTFQYRAPLATRPAALPEPSRARVEVPNAQRVVHYSAFLTRLNQSISTPSSRVRVPKSRWFKGFV